MKLYIINNARMPTEKAHGYQIAKMCESFAEQGVDVELLVPTRINDIKEDVFDYYKVSNNFKITYLNSFDFFKFEKIIGSKLSFYLQSLAFRLKVRKYKIESGVVVISRNPEIVQVFADKNIKVFYDAHRWPESKNEIFKKMLKNCAGVICNSEGTAHKFQENGFKNILVAPNGVDLSEYQQKTDKKEIRQKYNLPIDKKIIMYVGHLYVWKGVELIIKSAQSNNNQDKLFVFVGGTKKDIDKYKLKIKNKKIENIVFLGHKKKEEIAPLEMSADILVLPNVAISQESIKYTSPIKMFEYMASGVPIISSDLPSIREILNSGNSVLFKAGDVSDLNKKIEKLTKGKIDGFALARQAQHDVIEYSWEKRAKKILQFIKQLNHK